MQRKYNTTIMNHTMNLQEPHFTNVKTGIKQYEIRINDKKRQKMNIGDTVTINNDFTVKIIDKKIFKSFTDAITEYGHKAVLPDTNTFEEAIGVYNRFPHEKYGTYENAAKICCVVALKLEL